MSDSVQAHTGSMATFLSSLGSRLKSLSLTLKEQCDKSVVDLQDQKQALDEFAAAEASEMRAVSEEVVKVRAYNTRTRQQPHVHTHTNSHTYTRTHSPAFNMWACCNRPL